MTLSEGRRRQKHYARHRRRWRVKHPVATADPGRAEPVVPKVEVADVLKADDERLAAVIAAYRDDPVTGWA